MTLDRTLPPVAGAVRGVRVPHVERHVLACGMPLLVVERRALPVVDLAFVLRGGAGGDMPALAGRAALAADLLDEGTATRSALGIAQEAERLGASLYTRATWDETTAGLHVLSPRLDAALDLLVDVVLHPAFAADEIERKRRERLAGIVQERDEPRVIASKGFAREVYGDAHPYGAPIGGDEDSVVGLTREALAGFHADHLAPDHAFLVAVGDVEASTLAARLDALLAGWQATPQPMEPPPVAPVATQRTVRVLDRPGAPQSELRIGHDSASRGSSDYFPLVVLNTILGGAFTSRLNQRLREEKGFTYGAGSSFAFRSAGGPFLAASAVATAATTEAVAIVLEEMERMREERVGDAELERARSYIALGLPRRFEATGDVARHIVEQELYGLGDDYYSRYVERVSAVTADDVLAAAQRNLRPEAATIVIAGDRTAIPSSAKLTA